MEKVLVIVITADRVLPQCWDAIINQDYPCFDFLVHRQKPEVAEVVLPLDKRGREIVLTYINCAKNREAARKLALASDATRFLFVDSDVVIPPGTISELTKQPFDVIGGYYQVGGHTRYTCGRWVGDNLFLNLRAVEPSVTKVDCIGMGCAMFTRKALQDVVFEHGTDKTAKTWIDGQLVPMLLGECAALGNLLAEKGYQLYVDGNVVCEHLSIQNDVLRQQEVGV